MPPKATGSLKPATRASLKQGAGGKPMKTRYLGSRYQRGKSKRTQLKKLWQTPGSDISWGA